MLRRTASPGDKPVTTAEPSKPTAKQLRYLRALARSLDQTFATPATSRDASREIDRLLKAKRAATPPPAAAAPVRPDFELQPTRRQKAADRRARANAGATLKMVDPPAEPPPTAEQIHDLKVLAARVGEPIPPCWTLGTAAAEIHRLKAISAHLGTVPAKDPGKDARRSPQAKARRATRHPKTT